MVMIIIATTSSSTSIKMTAFIMATAAEAERMPKRKKSIEKADEVIKKSDTLSLYLLFYLALYIYITRTMSVSYHRGCADKAIARE